MNFENIKLVMRNENREFIRSKKISYLILVTIMIVVMNVAFSHFYGSANGRGEVYIIDGFKSFSQFSFIAYIGLLAPSISKEMDNFTWNYYLVNGINSKEILAAKYIFNFKVISISTNIVFLGMVLFVKTFKPFDISILGLILILLMLNLVILFLVITQVSASAIIKSTSKTSMFLIIYLLVSSMLNSIVPFLKGLIAPFDGASLQTHIVHQALGHVDSAYRELQNVLDFNIVLNTLLAFISTATILFIIIKITVYHLDKLDLKI
jgi:hypothetical protein